MTEYGWYVHSENAEAVAESAKYLDGVDVGAVLGERFDAAIQTVVEVNQTHPSGADRIGELQRVYREKVAGLEVDG